MESFSRNRLVESDSNGTLNPRIVPSLELLQASEMLLSTNEQAIDAEYNRKQIVDQNLKKLKKHFGDAFIKGERLESGEYAGEGARELLSTYIETPDFVDTLKKIIPSTHQSLQTLKDNLDYIIAILDEHYKDEIYLNKEIPKDPYILANQVGYTLTGPFEDIEDFASFAGDFRKGERICTFTNPRARLSSYHIMWLRRSDVDDVLPVDELTPENLTESWKKYLTLIGRYNPTSNTYNLNGLTPSREDPYGTSSMSVQVSRKNRHVSIKNRYNHTVATPDSTYQNNLDNIAEGLRLAIYHKLGRTDLMKVVNQHICNGYIQDNKGGVHRYYQEENNIYLGYFEYIEDGMVKTIDRGAYNMLTPNLYVAKNNSGNVIQPCSTDIQTVFEIQEDNTRNLHIYDSDNILQQTYSYRYDQYGNILDISLTINSNTLSRGIKNNPAIAKIILAEGIKIGPLYGNTALTELIISEKAEVESIQNNQFLTKITIASGARTGCISHNRYLKSLTICDNAKVSNINHSPVISSITIGKQVITGSIYNNQNLTKVVIGEGTKTANIYNNHPDITIVNQN